MAVQARGLVEGLRQRGVVARVVATNVPLGIVGRVRGLRGVVNLVIFLWRLLMAVWRVDVIHVLAASGLSFFLFAVPSIGLGRLTGRRVVVNYRGGLAESFLERRLRWVKPALRRCHRLVVPSAYLEAIFRRFGFPAEVIPNYIDLGRFSGRPPESPATPGRRFRILVARNLEPMYGLDTALDAFCLIQRHVPEVEMHLAGTGGQETALRVRVQREGLDAVRFLGRVPNEQMPSVYARADLVLNPTRVDNMPISVLEAWASGVPLVSTRAGGVVHLVEHGVNGWLAEVGDARGLAAGLLRIMRSPALATRLARAGRMAVRCLDRPRVVDAWIQVYRVETARSGPRSRNHDPAQGQGRETA